MHQRENFERNRQNITSHWSHREKEVKMPAISWEREKEKDYQFRERSLADRNWDRWKERGQLEAEMKRRSVQKQRYQRRRWVWERSTEREQRELRNKEHKRNEEYKKGKENWRMEKKRRKTSRCGVKPRKSSHVTVGLLQECKRESLSNTADIKIKEYTFCFPTFEMLQSPLTHARTRTRTQALVVNGLH